MSELTFKTKKAGSKNLRILQINSARNFGGGEKHLIDLSKGLTELGHKMFFVVRQSADWIDKLSQIKPTQTYKLPLRNALDINSAFRLAQIIKRENIEIVHAHLARDYSIAALAVRFSSNRAKLILTRHVLFPMNRLHRFALSNVSQIIAVSNAVKSRLLNDRIFAANKIKVIYNGIDVENRANAKRDALRLKFRSENGFSQDDFLIGTVGELKPLKGQADFIRAAKIVSSKFSNAKFIIVGKDNSKNGEFAKHLRKLADELNISAKIVWIDWLEDTAPLLQSLDVFVSASHSESFGLAIVEAMASNCAIVATKTEGASEILIDGETAKIAPICDHEGLANSINEFLSDETSRQRFGENAQTVAMQRFNISKMIDETEKLYADVLAS